MFRRKSSVFASAQAYSTHQSLQVRDAKEVLLKHLYLFKRNSNQSILDVGCGSGEFTYKNILPLLSEQGKLVGGDISEKMVEFASSNYRDPRLVFDVMDISDPKYCEKYNSSFDIIFSSYCLHWITDQWTAMKNIYSMLKPGGHAVLMFLTTHGVDKIYGIIGGRSRWSMYLKNYAMYICPYRNSIDPASEVSELMKNLGFEVLESTVHSKSFTYPSEELLLDSMEAVNPFQRRIPEHLMDEFIDEYNELLRINNCYTVLDTNEAVYNYNIITVHAHKPC